MRTQTTSTDWPALAQDTGGEPANDPATWITTADYPPSAIGAGEEGTVSFELALTPTGEVSLCETTGGTASQQLKDLTCELVTRRALFHPVRDAKEQAIPGSFSGTVWWEIPDDTAHPIPDPEEWSYSFVVETDGSVSSCDSTGFTGMTPAPMCEFADSVVFELPTDENGNPVRKRVRYEGRVVVEDIEE